MNDAINLSSNAAEALFVNKKEQSQNCPTEDNNDASKSAEENSLSEPPTKKKVIVARRKKSKVIRLNKQALNEIAQSFTRKHKLNVIKKISKKIKSWKIDFFNLSKKKWRKIVYARQGLHKCLLLLCNVTSIVRKGQLYVLPVETKFLFTLSVCTN